MIQFQDQACVSYIEIYNNVNKYRALAPHFFFHLMNFRLNAQNM